MNNILGLLFLSLLSSSVAIIYVAPTGSGTADGSSIVNPIGGLLNATLKANSTNDLNLVLLSGTYSADYLTLFSKSGWSITSLNGSTSTIINMGAATSPLVDLQSSTETLSFSKITILNGKFSIFRSLASGTSLSISYCVFRNVSFPSASVGAVVTTSTDMSLTFDNNLVVGCKTPTLLLVGGSPIISNNKFIQNNDGTVNYAISFKNSVTKNMTVDNNIFVENYGAVDTRSANIIFTNNKLYSNGGQTLACTSVTFANTSGTVFCGTNGNNLTNCASYSSTDTRLKSFDGCKVCNAYNENKDCTGTCWGTTSSCPSSKKWYVSTSGSGNGNYTSPLGNIQTAIGMASYGDSIVLFPGTYSISTSLTIGKGITITKDSSGEIYNTIISPAAGITAFTITSSESYDTKISSITISGSSSINGAIQIQDASPTIDNVLFTSNTGPSIYIRENCFSRISNSQFLSSSISSSFAPVDIRFFTSGTTVHATINNCRFESNSGTYSSIYQASSGGSLTITSNIFKHSTGFVVNVGNLIALNAYSNSFTNNTGNVITCTLSSSVNQSSNVFCGGTTSSCSAWTGFTISSPDSCGVCGGNNSSKDCNGTCFGYKTIDTSQQLCCLNSAKDCGGYCNNIFSTDKYSTCCNRTSIDCENICYQGKINDTHGGCCFNNQTDCAGYCFGTRQPDKTLPSPLCCFTNQTDCGGYCNGTRKTDNTLPTPLCCFTNQTDCGGYCNGTRKTDNTLPTPLCCFTNQTDCGGYCNGTRKTDSSLPTAKCCFTNQTDCANICNGTSIYDDYSTCCESSTIDCSDKCNGTNVIDKYQQCCSPLVKDCTNECWGGRKNDSLGKCCYSSSMDCSGECFGLKIKDSLGNCCLPTFIDCNNTCNGNSVFDNSLPLSKCCKSSDLDCDRICFGGKTNDTLGDCCIPEEIDCDGHCNGTKVWDLSLPKVCCESSSLDCADFCNGNHKRDDNNMCCDASLIVCGKCGGSTPCNSNTTSTSSTSSSSSSSTSASTTTTTADATTGTTASTGANGIGGNGADQTKSATATSFGTREILYVVLAVLWVLVIVAVISVLCIIRKRRNN